jgi:hypothetical protein
MELIPYIVPYKKSGRRRATYRNLHTNALDEVAEPPSAHRVTPATAGTASGPTILEHDCAYEGTAHEGTAHESSLNTFTAHPVLL